MPTGATIGGAVHPTRARLLDAAVELLETTTPEDLGIAMVLERSGVSHGSLYHHFEDFGDLVEQALAHRYVQHLRVSVDAIRSITEQARSGAEYRRLAEALTRESHRPERREWRMQRARVATSLAGRPRLATVIAHEQQLVTDTIVELLRHAQEQGWIRADADLAVAAVFFQALTLGRIVDDIAEQHVDPKAWEEAAVRVTYALLYDPASGDD